jgi:predicted transcriptional regulator
MAFGDRLGIIRFCETPKNKDRIISKLGLNEVQAESYLTILTKQSILMQNNGKYVITEKGQGFISSSDRVRRIKAQL